MLRCVLFGAGRIGRIHAANIALHPQLELAGVVDVDDTAAAQLAGRYGARALRDATEALATRPHAALIASPTDTHEELIAACVAARVPVLCEKPLDLDPVRARASLDLAASAGVPLFIGFNRRFDPSFARLRAEIGAGALGALEVLSITSRDPAPPPAEYVRRSGGLFRDMMIHDFDMARWLLGSEIVEVVARGACLVDPAIGEAGDIDTAAVILRAASGALCQITNSRRCSYGYDQRIEAFGAHATARAGNQTATRVEIAAADGVRQEPALPFFLERYAEAYRLELDDFARVLGGKPAAALATATDGLRALQLAEAAERALRSGASVRPEE